MGNVCLGQYGNSTGGFAGSCGIIEKGKRMPRTVIGKDEEASPQVFLQHLSINSKSQEGTEQHMQTSVTQGHYSFRQN